MTAGGHEGDFAPDGLTYYASTILNPPKPAIIPIDVEDPSRPRALLEWQNPLDTQSGFHAIQVSEDGRTGYFMAQGGNDNGLAVVDVSDVQARRPDPQMRLLGHLPWEDGSIGQIAVEARIGGRDYVIANDEMGSSPTSARASCQAGLPPWGYPRIIDMTEPTTPKVVSKLPLEVNDPAVCTRSRPWRRRGRAPRPVDRAGASVPEACGYDARASAYAGQRRVGPATHRWTASLSPSRASRPEGGVGTSDPVGSSLLARPAPDGDSSPRTEPRGSP